MEFGKGLRKSNDKIKLERNDIGHGKGVMCGSRERNMDKGKGTKLNMMDLRFTRSSSHF